MLLEKQVQKYPKKQKENTKMDHSCFYLSILQSSLDEIRSVAISMDAGEYSRAMFKLGKIVQKIEDIVDEEDDE